MDDQPMVPSDGAGTEPAIPAVKKRHGCLKGCLTVVGVFILIAVLLLGWFFNWPRRWGLVASPAEELFEGSPNPWAADAIVADLQEMGVSAEGITVYVLRVPDSEEIVAYVLVEDARGAAWSHEAYRSAVEGLLVLVSQTEAASRYAVTRVAVDYRDAENIQVAVMTVPAEAGRAYGAGEITREAFFATANGNADIAGFLGGMLE